MTNIEIRETRPGDGEACARMWREVGGLFAERQPEVFRVPAAEGLEEWFEEISATFRDSETMVLLVAEVDGVLVGNVSATLHEPLDTAARQLQSDLGRRRLHVDSLGVTASHRRGGVGSALMRAVEEWGRSRGAEVVVLETDFANPMSVPFYRERMGFAAQAIVFRKEMDRP